LKLEWNSQEGRQYNVLTSDNLTNWVPVVSGIASTPPSNTYTVAPDGPKGFYRVVGVPAP
jgi:hypothetical protein